VSDCLSCCSKTSCIGKQRKAYVDWRQGGAPPKLNILTVAKQFMHGLSPMELSRSEHSVVVKVHADTSQCADSPLRILLLLSGIQLAEEVSDEPRIPIF